MTHHPDPARRQGAGAAARPGLREGRDGGRRNGRPVPHLHVRRGRGAADRRGRAAPSAAPARPGGDTDQRRAGAERRAQSLFAGVHRTTPAARPRNGAGHCRALQLGVPLVAYSRGGNTVRCAGPGRQGAPPRSHRPVPPARAVSDSAQRGPRPPAAPWRESTEIRGAGRINPQETPDGYLVRGNRPREPCSLGGPSAAATLRCYPKSPAGARPQGGTRSPHDF